MMEKLKEFFAGSLGVVLVLGYIGNIPLAFIFGDKWDVLISFPERAPWGLFVVMTSIGGAENGA